MKKIKLTAKQIFRRIFLPLIFLLPVLMTQAQNKTITGRVTSTSGEALPGVTVAEKNAGNTTTSDNNGNYSIAVNNANATLLFSYVNYANQEVPLRGRSSLNISLAPGEGNLGEVVVIGYGTVKKSDVTGSVASIKAKDFTQGANISVEQSLAGRVAGVQISQKSGEPGGAMNIKIRGISSVTGGNDPLYVIDGNCKRNGAAVRIDTE